VIRLEEEMYRKEVMIDTTIPEDQLAEFRFHLEDSDDESEADEESDSEDEDTDDDSYTSDDEIWSVSIVGGET